MSNTCTVYFLDPMGNRTETWQIGNDGIPPDVYARLKDDQGNMYALTVYEAGEPQTSFLKKEIWKMAEAEFEQIERAAATGFSEAKRKLGL